jgi:hypothetical protein
LENIESFSRLSEMNYEYMELSTAKGYMRILEKDKIGLKAQS